MRNRYQLIISVISAFYFCSSIKAHMFVLVSPQVCSYQRASSGNWEHLADGGPELTCCQGVERPNTWIQSGHWVHSVCLKISGFDGLSVCGFISLTVLISEKKSSADLHGSKRFLLTGSITLKKFFSMCFKSKYLCFTSEDLSQKTIRGFHVLNLPHSSFAKRVVTLIGCRRLRFKT